MASKSEQGIWENRAWKQTAQTTPDNLKGQTLQTRVLALTDDPAEAARRGFIAAGAPDEVKVKVTGIPEEMAQTVAHAIIDALNDQGIALNRQKRLNTKKTGYFDTEDSPTLEGAQEVMDAEPVLTPKDRRVGGPSKEKERIEKGRRAEQAASEASEEELAVLKKFGLA